MAMFRLVLEEYIHLAKLRRSLEKNIHQHLEHHIDYKRLRSVPGIGPIVALTVLAEAGDLRRFSHHRKFLKFCGFDLSTSQSGQHRGIPQLSKREMRSFAALSGWPAELQSRNVATVSERSLTITCAPTRTTPISSAKHILPLQPKWRASYMGS
jgi:hypothetical protein